MNIKLSKPFASNGKAEEVDTRAVKTALNRLGYYTPYEKTGITDIPDREVFAALKKFQKQSGLPATGEVKPGDETEAALRKMAVERKGQYIWRTVGDAKVRKTHAALEGQVCDWEEFPAPGDEEGCRCWAIPVSDDIEKEDLPPPNIPGTNIPDKGIPEDGGKGNFDPDKIPGEKDIDPDMEKKPPFVDPYMPIYPRSPSPPIPKKRL